MGYIQHDALVIVTHDARPGGIPDVEAFRASLPAEFRKLIVGPVDDGGLNGYVMFAMLPDGSKEGWDHSSQADEIREAFKDLFRQRYDDGSSADDWVHVRFGGEHRDRFGGTVEDQWPPAGD